MHILVHLELILTHRVYYSLEFFLVFMEIIFELD